MPVRLHVEPNTPPQSGEAFKGRAGPFGIALDGYVDEAPWYDPAGPWRNFNHHEDVDRLSMRATCGQVLMAIRQGLFERFRDDQGPRAEVYVNDCDEDVCLSWYLLSHHEQASSALNPKVNALVWLSDAMDTTAGAYPFPPDTVALQELAWVFQPYREFRAEGGVGRREAEEFRAVIEAVGRRVGAYVGGIGGKVDLDTRYQRIGGGVGWTMVREEGAQARTGMFADGVRAFVSVVNRPQPGRWTYVVGRMSDYVDFPLPQILDALNTAEGCEDDEDRWGGSTTIGGSPRIAGSRLDPDDVHAVIEELLADRRAR